ncbi:hypothetical protein LTR91_012807 [Friedmanniomyces endolithicus]|uniref:Uncharacterized protein n=1 Tax=Friedmanniomyces endolithicus TaxID=329885 RepID=A0AAN6KF02_9PEZI|nr:hypothetical protein LTR59_005667 [Friedmanniomyces endolithicus]KAK0865010.1 hypothetical protein LTS02_005653 [Friedmanniomyces endolithicus]KAK0904279.1 hypothetical protein LTR57_018810 [Friedmanniomyces endolithicus]KAK0978967.1 hypothetical protein LTR91_012807 [Friedmanniomyces endolithicus]
MSQSMPIPARKHHHAATPSWSSSSSSSSSSYPATPPSGASPATTPSLSKGKFPAYSPPLKECISPRRPSLLGSSLTKSEYTVINLGHGNGPPRLVTCVKSSQGFDWNQELFLPSYADYDSLDLEHKAEPVQDIILTDEEAAAMLPQ